MKRTEKDYEYLETSPEASKRGLRRITRPKFLDKLNTAPSREAKSRITINIDTDILDFFKSRAEAAGNPPYQTQINNELRKAMETLKLPEDKVLTLKMLDNPDFISALAEKLKAAQFAQDFSSRRTT